MAGKFDTIRIRNGNKHLYVDDVNIMASLIIDEDVIFEAPKLQTIGEINFRPNSKLIAPKLICAGTINLDENTTMDVPNLGIVTSLNISGQNTKITSSNIENLKYICLFGEATLAVPIVKYVDDIWMGKNTILTAPKLINFDVLTLNHNAKINIPLLEGLNYRSVDNYVFVIESSKMVNDILIERGYTFGRTWDGVPLTTKCYVASKDGFNAHGKTVKDSVESLIFKISQDKLKKEPISSETIINIDHYRAITGACELGVSMWIKNVFPGGGVSSMGAGELLPLLKKHNAWGVDKFEQLLNR